MTHLPDLLPIVPFTRPARGEVTLPGSKSITNRALLLAALCDGPVTLTGALFSEDTEIMAEALNRLGIEVKSDPEAKTFQVAGQGGNIPAQSADLFVGNAGTAARFLTAVCAAAKSGIYRLDGVPQMRKRPMKGLIDALRSLGADIRCTGVEGFFPLEIHARGLRSGKVEIDVRESSQMLSALLMVAPSQLQKSQFAMQVNQLDSTTVGDAFVFSFPSGVRWPFVRMTTRLMEQFGQPTFEVRTDDSIRVENSSAYTLATSTYAIEPDATAASYFMALPLAVTRRGALLLRGLSSDHRGTALQGDSRFFDVIEELGCETLSRPGGVEVLFPGIAHRVGEQPRTREFREFSDTFLTLAAIAPLLEGPTTITGIAHTRKQETDRVAGMARELHKLGQDVVETEDSLTITPRPLTPGVEIETYGDHRFAMSFAILGCHDLLGNGRPWLSIKNPACCAKTFPNFFDVLRQVWETSHSKP